MAFSTELVLAAQTGPGVDYKTVSTAERTTTTSSYSTLASVPVGEGTWLVAFSAPVRETSLSRYWDISINGDETRISTSSSGQLDSTTVIRHVVTITGPVTVDVKARWGKLYAGTLHIARIG